MLASLAVVVLAQLLFTYAPRSCTRCSTAVRWMGTFAGGGGGQGWWCWVILELEGRAAAWGKGRAAA